MSEIKKWAELILSLVFTVLGEFMAWLNLERLQKIYYLLAAALMVVAIWKILTNRKLDIEKISKPASIVDQARDPNRSGETLLKTLRGIKKIIKKGGIKMKQFFKDRTWVQWASFIASFLLLLIGILSAFVPALAVVGQNLEAYLIALGVLVAPGLLSKGKQVGQAVKSLLPAKERRRIRTVIKSWQKKLDNLTSYYREVIEIAEDVKALGGTLTSEQQILYDTYVTQKKSIETKIEGLTRELEVPSNE